MAGIENENAARGFRASFSELQQQQRILANWRRKLAAGVGSRFIMWHLEICATSICVQITTSRLWQNLCKHRSVYVRLCYSVINLHVSAALMRISKRHTFETRSLGDELQPLHVGEHNYRKKNRRFRNTAYIIRTLRGIRDKHTRLSNEHVFVFNIAAVGAGALREHKPYTLRTLRHKTSIKTRERHISSATADASLNVVNPVRRHALARHRQRDRIQSRNIHRNERD